MIAPFFHLHARRQVRQQLRGQGLGALDALRLSNSLDDDAIEEAATTVNATQAVAALGDGTVLQKILAFFQSDLGKALISLLVSLLLA